jgi:hypothetical protein
VINRNGTAVHHRRDKAGASQIKAKAIEKIADVNTLQVTIQAHLSIQTKLLWDAHEGALRTSRGHRSCHMASRISGAFR